MSAPVPFMRGVDADVDAAEITTHYGMMSTATWTCPACKALLWTVDATGHEHQDGELFVVPKDPPRPAGPPARPEPFFRNRAEVAMALVPFLALVCLFLACGASRWELGASWLALAVALVGGGWFIHTSCLRDR